MSESTKTDAPMIGLPILPGCSPTATGSYPTTCVRLLYRPGDPAWAKRTPQCSRAAGYHGRSWVEKCGAK